MIPAGRRRVIGPVLLLTTLMAACQHQPAVAPNPHYVLGEPYQAGGVWHYPNESYDLSETGLAQVIAPDHAALTSNGERFDQTAMAAAHATLQLPAIARVTDLETGRSVVVRINDRGEGNPHRLIELTSRAAALLGMAQDKPARVRLQVMPAESHDAVDTIPGAPHLNLTAVPRGAVEVAALPPLPGARQGRGHVITAAPAAEVTAAVTPVPVRLPEVVTQDTPNPGRLWVRLDSFEDYQYAAVLRARLIALHPRITQLKTGKSHTFLVEAGPYDDVRQAEAVLDQALAASVPDARIVVE